MTIGKFGDPNPEPYFALLRLCRDQIAESLGISEEELELSMGMSGEVLPLLDGNIQFKRGQQCCVTYLC